MSLMSDTYNSFFAAGISPISRHTAAKILALCCIFGDEAFVFNHGLHELTLAAAKLMHVRPMEIPSPEDSELIRHYAREIYASPGKKPSWQEDMENTYGFTLPAYEDPHEEFKTRWNDDVCIS